MARAGSAPCRAVILDARRGEVYGGLFGADQNLEIVAPLSHWLQSLSNDVGEFLAFDFGPYETTLRQSRFAEAQQTVVPRAIASAVAAIARGRYELGQVGDPAFLDANYVRRSDAELLFKPLER